jgi:delta1-piperideine-2-carboxylate reductase
MTRLTLDEVRRLAAACLERSGADADNAAAVADIVWAAERDGCASHGLFRIPGYCASLKSGKVDGTARPKPATLAPGVLRIDNGGGFAPLAVRLAHAELPGMARAQGIAAAAIVNSYHFAALWPEVERLADEGLAAMAFTASTAYVAPAGGSKPLYGTNPMAFAWPRKDAPPLVFDQASAAMARGEIMIAARDGHAVPEGAGVDAEGNPTTDPAAILDGGAQLAFGGYKGAAIAMMVELLVGGLIGDAFSFESAAADNRDGGPSVGGELIIAMDPARFGDADGFLDHSERLFERIKAQPGTRLPSERRFKLRTETPEAGTEIPEALHTELLTLAGEG